MREHSALAVKFLRERLGPLSFSQRARMELQDYAMRMRVIANLVRCEKLGYGYVHIHSCSREAYWYHHYVGLTLPLTHPPGRFTYNVCADYAAPLDAYENFSFIEARDATFIEPGAKRRKLNCY